MSTPSQNSSNQFIITGNTIGAWTINFNRGNSSQPITINYYYGPGNTTPTLGDSPILFNLTNPISKFHGRRDYLDQLCSALEDNRMVAIFGENGVGKTQLVRHFISKNRNDYKHILWFNAEDVSNLKFLFLALAEKLSVETKNGKRPKAFHLILHDVYKKLKGSVLLVFDNVEDECSIKPFLPCNNFITKVDISVIITSQSTKWSDNIIPINLLPLSEDNGLNLVKAILDDGSIIDANKNDWFELIRDLNGIPLYLRIMAAYIKQEMKNNTFSINDFLRTLEEKELKISVPNLINKTFLASVQLIIEEVTENDHLSTVVSEILNICSYLHPEFITISIVTTLVSVQHVNKIHQVLNLLQNYALIKILDDNIRIHDLVQVIIRSYLKIAESSNILNALLNEAIHDPDNQMTFHRRNILQHTKPDVIEKFYNNHSLKPKILRLLSQNGCSQQLQAIFDNMMQLRVSLNIWNYSLLYESACSGDLKTVELMYNYNQQVNRKQRLAETPLQAAVDMGYDLITEFLIKKGATLKKLTEGKTQLHVSITEGCWNLARFLINKEHNVNVQDKLLRTPLHYAAKQQCTDVLLQVIQILLDKSAEVDIQDKKGKTPIHYAVSSLATETVRKLVEQSKNIDIQSKELQTALHLALLEDCYEIVVIITDNGASLDLVDNKGRNALHLAAKRGNLEAVKLFISKECPLDKTNEKGWSALHYAARYGFLDIVRELVDKGASLDIETKDHYTALDLAVKWKFKEIVQLLRDHNGKTVKYAIKDIDELLDTKNNTVI